MDSLEKVLQNPVIFKSVYELIEPEDTMNVGSIYKVPFTRVYQCFDLYREGKVLEALALILDMAVEKVLESPANHMMRFMKWQEAEIQNCLILMNSIPSVKDDDMTAAGVSDLNELGEFNIYRSITKDPRQWDEIANVPFEYMYIKLKGDGLDSVIQHNYNNIIKNKK